MEIACEAKKGKPSPALSWAISANSAGTRIMRHLGISAGKKNSGKTESNVGSDEVTNSVEVKEKGLFTAKSILRYHPLPRDDGKFLVCLVKHAAVEGSMVAAAELIVECKS